MLSRKETRTRVSFLIDLHITPEEGWINIWVEALFMYLPNSLCQWAKCDTRSIF